MFDVIINDRSTNALGLSATSYPLIPAPEKKYIASTVLNRDGALYRDMGTYEDIKLSIPFNFYTMTRQWGTYLREFQSLIQNARELMFSDDQQVFWKVKKARMTEIERVTPQIGRVKAEFTLDPHTYVVAGKWHYQDLSEVEYNLYAECCPLYLVSGNGSGTLTVNGHQVSFIASGLLYLDTDKEIAYDRENRNRNASISGQYRGLRLQPGQNSISVSDGFSLAVIPNWRVL
ncbi:hypothetical protein [Faecalibaculum rodentium]|uniref:hypothetical protein n=1 Tax=Faecalibaculum rodentium TaxID=1702221 RepID=UPI0023F0E64B|nr:hypothetical protein [Faecalibaculum rodentium]